MTISSTPSSTLNLTSATDFWLKDPTDSTANVKLWLAKESDPSHYFNEQVQAFRGLGRSHSVVLADIAPVMTRGGSLTVRVKNDTDLATLMATALRQKTLMLQLRETMYVRIINRVVAGPDIGNRREVTLSYVQVDAP